MPLCNIQYTWGFFPVQQIWTTLRNNATRLGVNHQEIENGLRNVALAIDTRGQILRATVSEAKRRMAEVEKLVSDNELRRQMAKVETGLLYGMLCSVDSFLFESWSLYNLLERFYVSLLRRAKLEPGKRAVESFDKLVEKAEDEVGNNWLAYLRANRRLLYHETAPYAVIKFTTGTLSKREVMIESQPNEYLTKVEFDKVLKGLSRLSNLCPQDLIEKMT